MLPEAPDTNKYSYAEIQLSHKFALSNKVFH